MEQREEFSLRFFNREDRTRIQLQTLCPANDPASPKAAAVLPTDDMTFKDFSFLGKNTGRALADADQVIFQFIDVAQAYLILQDCEEAGLFTGPGHEQPVNGDLWAVQNGEWRLVDENVWSNPLWKDPVELADFIKEFQPESAPPQAAATVEE